MKEKLLSIFLLVLSVCSFKSYAQQNITIGTGTTGNTSFGYPCPLQDYYEGSRAQFLYRASELTAAGMGPGAISAIKFEALNLNGFGGEIQQFQVKIGGSPVTTLGTTTWETVATSVFGPVDYVVTAGVNTLTFATPFNWNGSDNIVIEICNGLPANTTDGLTHYTQNPTFAWTEGLSFNGSHSYRADNTGNLCGTTATAESGTATIRPNIVFSWTSSSVCTGTPVAGTAVASTTNITCAGTPFNLSLTGTTVASGITYKWQSSPNNTTWTDLPGGTTSGVSVLQTLPSVYYRCIVTCTNGAATSTSTSVLVTSASGPVYAVLPFTEGFEATWLNACNTRDVPGASWKNTPPTGNTSWRRNDDGPAAAWSSTNGAYTPAASTGTSSARFHSYDAATGTQGSLDLYLNCSLGTSTQRLNFDYINTNGNDSLTVLFSTDGGLTFNRLDSVRTSLTWKTKTLDFVSTSATTVVRFRGTGDFGTTDIGLDNISIFNLVNCSGTPTAGTITGTPLSACSGSTVTFALSGQSNGFSGIGLQWQSSPNNTTWTNITGATGTSYSFVIPAGFTPTYYRMLVSCTPSTLSAATNSLQVNVNNPLYSTLPFQEQFENPWQSICNTREVPANNWRNSPNTGNTSWRRDDDGIAAAWAVAATGAYLPSGSNNTPHSARFHSNSAGATGSGTLDVYIDCNSTPATKRLVFDYINTTGTDSLDVLLSTNGGTSFTRLATYKIAAAWTNQVVDFTSSSATTVVRLRATGGGNTDIGVDELNIFNLTNCTGTPISGIISSSTTSICIGNTVAFAVTGQTYGQAGISYQWQSSPNNTTWTDITGETGIVYNLTIASGYVSSYFRLLVKCSLTSTQAASNSIFVVLPAPTYAALPFLENFENNWINFCSTKDVPNNSWRNAPFTGNNSWRRDDDGTSGGWGSTFGNYTPAGSGNSAHSARFHTYNATSGTGGNFDLYLNCSTGGATKRLTFDYINTTGNDSLTVSLSSDNGLTFTRLDSVRTSTVWKTKTIIFNATSATTVLRFRGNSDFGTTDIGLDSVRVIAYPNCSGTPAGGIAAASQTTACIGSVINLTASGNTIDQGGLSYKWQISTDNAAWSDIAGATTAAASYTIPSGFTGSYFRSVTSCSFSAASANSTSVQVTVPAAVYLAIPLTENFDSTWVTTCATRDAPKATGWKNIPFIGNNAWRRDDDTTGGGWTNMNGAPTPAGANGTLHSARIHTYSTALNGNLDLFLNCTTGTENKEVSFYYSNRSGNDSLRVFVSLDGGITFNRAGVLYTRVNDWEFETVAFVSTSATTVVRFAAYGAADATSDIAIDQVSVKAVDCAQPLNITVNVTSPSPSQSIANISWNGLPNALAYEVAYSTSNTPPYYGDITGSTNFSINTLLPVTQYYVYVRTLCFNGGISSWYAVNFVTPCPFQPLPYAEGFESITTANQLPNCMSATVLGTNVFTYTAAQTLYNRTPHSGTSFASFRYGTPVDGSWIFSQPLNLTAGVVYDASVWYRTDGLTGWTSLAMFAGPTQSAASMVKIDSIANVNNTVYQQMYKYFSVPTSGTYYLGVRVIATFAPFYLSVDDLGVKLSQSLPVTLLKFAGQAVGDLNRLQWITSTEANNKGFELQSSADGRNFNTLRFLPSQAINGNSSQALTYNFDDLTPLQGNNYYRLKQIDKDGKVTYSQIVLIRSNRVYQLLVNGLYPNPASSKVTVSIASPKKQTVQFVVTDIIGKTITNITAQLNQGDNQVPVNVSGFSSGSYILKVVCAEGCNTAVTKFIKE